MQTLTLGDRIQILRKNMKMSQKDFAVFLNIPQPLSLHMKTTVILLRLMYLLTWQINVAYL